MANSDQSSQVEEIETLKEICSSEDLQISENDFGLLKVDAWVYLDLPEGYKVKYSDSGGDHECQYLFVKHLPPIHIQIILPENYPSTSMPEVTLKCPWLSDVACSRLEDQLFSVWKLNKHCHVIHFWLEFLRTESLSFLGMVGALDITWRSQQLIDKVNSTAQSSATDEALFCDNETCETNGPGGTLNDSCSHSVEGEPFLVFLETFDVERDKFTFLKSYHMCEICCSEKTGKDSMLFENCNHVFCRECLSHFFTLQIEGGDVISIRCPAHKCESQVTQAQVRELVSDELFVRYDTMLLNMSISSMSDAFCPRRTCQYPVSREPGGRFAICPSCDYSFCLLCKRGYHGVEPCELKEDEKYKLAEEYHLAKWLRKKQLEKMYGRKKLMALLTLLSDDWLKENSKKCPQCKSPIEKISGCDRLECTICKFVFCWYCRGPIKSNLHMHEH